MIPLIAAGLSLGLNAGFLPGPTQTYLIQTSLAYGWRRAIPGAFAPLVADVPVVLLALLVLSNVPVIAIQLLRIGGGLFILWLAFSTLRSIRAGAVIGAGSDEGVGLTTRQLFARVVVINILSPGPWLFWSTVNGPLLVQGLQISLLHGLAFLVSFYGMLIGGLCVVVLAFGWLRTLNPRITRGLMLASTGILALLGVLFILQGLGIVQA
ncbi:MAG TPA: LysE family transporter [Candidatus Limnocylindrales bacterium]|nr:LysE family transporter [Candidatus Limnocylindrales bacterium]